MMQQDSGDNVQQSLQTLITRVKQRHLTFEIDEIKSVWMALLQIRSEVKHP